MTSVAVIPARYASTRFPGKPLAEIAGRPMIEHVYRRAADARGVDAVVVATDDERVASAVERFGGIARMTGSHHRTGMDRIAEVARDLHCSIVVNVQGDEPLIDIATVDALIDLLREHGTEMATMACPLTSDEELQARDVVKVVIDERGNALYFSRAPIGSRDTALRHIGVYAYRRSAIERFVSLPPAPLERAESLEQLRALHHGFRIAVYQTARPHLGVDRPEDVARVESELAKLHA